MTIRYDLISEAKNILASNILKANIDKLFIMFDKYERYLATKKGVPIFSRSFKDEEKVNNKINNDFVGEIIDTKLGYMASIPITYSYNSITDIPLDTITNSNINIDSNEQSIIDKFIIKENINDLNYETLKYASVCGTATRLCYIDTDGYPAVTCVAPWTVAYVYDGIEKNVLAAVRYYVEYHVTENKFSSVLKAEYYDSQYVYYLIEDTTDNTTVSITDMAAKVQTTSFKFTYDISKPMYKQKHGFVSVPLVEYVNNSDRLGDCDKVLALIDVYDRCLSDETSEIEQFRLAYLACYGLEADAAALAKMKQTGAFAMTKDGKVEFITKEINATALENLLKQLKANIIKFSKSVDFSDEHFASNLSGIAIKYKLTPLEHKCSITELKFKTADAKMWYLISNVFNFIKYSFEYEKITATFTRKIPVSLLEEARIQRELKGHVSNKTRLSLASFIQNPTEEIKQMQLEVVTGVTSMLDDFYDSLNNDMSESNTTLGNNLEAYNEWRMEHRQSGKAPEAVTDDNN